jgi:prepilin-type N-terminal cleavage/methylation domain-containing protein
MKSKRAVTMMEMLTVIVIIGVLATLGVAVFSASSNSAYDREAQAILRLLRSAQESYMVDMGTYYPASGNSFSVLNINSNLKVLISTSSKWTYTVFGGNDGCSQAASTELGRTWHIDISDPDGEPDSGGC